MAYFEGVGGSGGSIVVTCDSEFAGSTISCSDGTNTMTAVCPSVSPYEVEFMVSDSGTYEISATLSGTTYTTEIVVNLELEAALEYGFSWSRWVTYGGLDPTDYTDLEDVFDDEVAVRRLMTIHASADYLIEKVTDDIDTIDDFTANDTAMKWIGLRDYVCDGLTAITGVEAKFLASQYWERYLKDHVPVMTAASAPYGTVSASGAPSGYESYKAFDNNDTTFWLANTTGYFGNGAWIRYNFINPICVKKMHILFRVNPTSSAVTQTITYRIEGSNDGNTFESITTFTTDNTSATADKTITFDNDNYYLYYRFYVVSGSTASGQNGAISLQFYGRSLDVSVPVMTSDTAPYGEVSAGNIYGGQYGWLAFDGKTNTGWLTSNAATDQIRWVQYDFSKPVKISALLLTNASYQTDRFIKTFKVQASNNPELGFVDIYSGITASASSHTELHYFDSDSGYRYYRINALSSWSDIVSIDEMQFYGVDYSEKEFETGSTKKWLYDHGVELETIDITGTATKDDDYITLSAANAQASHTLNLTPYDLLRGKVGDHMSGTTALIAGTTATANMTAANAPNNESLDVSSVNASLATGAKMTSTGICDITELWLE